MFLKVAKMIKTAKPEKQQDPNLTMCLERLSLEWCFLFPSGVAPVRSLGPQFSRSAFAASDFASGGWPPGQWKAGGPALKKHTDINNKGVDVYNIIIGHIICVYKVYIYVYVYVCVYVYVYIYIHINISLSLSMCIYIYIYTCVCIHIYIT